jgi:hypothetical protein
MRLTEHVASGDVGDDRCCVHHAALAYALLVVGVDDRTEPHRDGGTRDPSNPSLGSDPLAFENNVIPRSSNAQITGASRWRSSGSHSELKQNDTTDPQFVELFVATLTHDHND